MTEPRKQAWGMHGQFDCVPIEVMPYNHNINNMFNFESCTVSLLSLSTRVQ